MTTAGAHRSAAMSTLPVDVVGDAQDAAEVDAPLAPTIHSCSRLGRTANPPRFSLLGWLRSGRRR